MGDPVLHHVGDGHFPDQRDLRLATAPENRCSMDEIDNLLPRSAQNFRSATRRADEDPEESRRAIAADLLLVIDGWWCKSKRGRL